MCFEFIENSSKYHNVKKFASDEMSYGVVIDGEMKSMWFDEVGAALGADAYDDINGNRTAMPNRYEYPEVMKEYEKFVYLQSQIPFDFVKAFIACPPDELLNKDWDSSED